YRAILGTAAHAFGAPGWQCSPASLASEDAMQLAYHSDTRGAGPFIPEMDGERFRTVEIPTTLPTLDETYGRIGTTVESLAAYYAQQLRPGLNVYTAHAEMEGVGQLPIFRDFLERVRPRVEYCRLLDVAQRLDAVPVGRIIRAPIAGRSGTVA